MYGKVVQYVELLQYIVIVVVTDNESSVGRAPVCCAGGREFEPQTGPTLRVLK